jgi:RNA polymerase sigma-70 factor (ECF subfamily)
MDDEAQFARLISGLRSGDEIVVREFCDRYGDLLHRLADRHLPDRLRRRLGPEDVVQSAYRTFLRRARAGEFRLQDSEGLWRLLCAITLTKVREQMRFHLRQKRGLAQEVGLPTRSPEDSTPGFEPAATDPSPAAAAEFADQFQRLLNSLDDEERQVVDLKLQDYTNDEVAERLGCSERTVRRLVKRVQAQLIHAFEADAPA